MKQYFLSLPQVETYGSMEKKEKVEFILEQMRLCIAVKDYIRTQIISKKINTKFFQEEGTEVKQVVIILNTVLEVEFEL